MQHMLVKGKLKLQKGKTGYFTKIYKETYFISTNKELPEYIEYDGKLNQKNLYLYNYKEIEKFDVSNGFTAKRVDYGVDFETAVKHNELGIILPKEDISMVNKENSEAFILAGAFVSRDHEFIYDHTKMDISELENFLFNKQQKIFRFYNLEFDGKYILSLLFKNGFTEVDEFSKYGEIKEFIALKNPMGKIFSIEYKYSVGEEIDGLSGLPYRNSYTTKIIDTYKLFPATGLGDALKGFSVKTDKGKDLRKLEFDFSRKDTYDQDGQLTPKFIRYMKKDAEGARRLYHTFINTLGGKKKLDFLTIGSVAWRELLERCFDGDKKRFKEITGDITPAIEDKYRKTLYRGGYGLLNDKFYLKDTYDVYHADYVSMYPSLMKNEIHPIGLGVEYNKYTKPTKERKIAVHQIEIYRADIKDGYFPILINGRKGIDTNNYIWNFPREDDVDKKLVISMFEEYDNESEYSIFLRTYKNLQYKVLSSRLFETTHGIFDDFINYWYPIKENAPKDSPERMLSKLILNNSFGKIGENFRKEKTKFVTDEEGDLVVLTRSNEYNETETRNVFIAANITHRGRVKVWLDAEKIGFNRVILIATDGIFWTGEEPGLQFGKTLGDLDLEDAGVRMWGFGEKSYQIYNENTGKLITKSNGMKAEVKETLKYTDLKPGLTFTMLKKNNFVGGAVLIETELKLKDRDLSYQKEVIL